MNKFFLYLFALVFTTSNANSSTYSNNANKQSQNYKSQMETSFLTIKLSTITNSNKIAATHWLPDLQASFQTNSSPDESPTSKKSECKDYGFFPTKPDISKYDFITKKNVDAQGLECYTNIKCKSKFQYTSSNCFNEHQLAGSSCDDKFDECAAKPCSTAGYYNNIQSGMICSPQTYGGRTCQSCTVDNCYNLKDFDTPYGCKQTYASCNTKCQLPYPDNCHNYDSLDCQYGCETYFDDCSEKCKTCKVQNNIGKVYVKFTEINCKKEPIPEGQFMAGRHPMYIHANIKCIDNKGREFWNRDSWANYGSLIAAAASAPDISYCERFKSGITFSNDQIYESMNGGCSFKDSGLSYCTQEYFIANYIDKYGIWAPRHHDGSNWVTKEIDCDGNNSSSYILPFGSPEYEKY